LLRPLRDLLKHRLARFAIVGGVVTVFFMSLNAVLTRAFSCGSRTAFCIAYPFALGLHFTLNKLWTFERRERVDVRQVIEYLLAAAITFLIQFPSFLLLQRLGLPNWLAAGGANVVQMGASYLLLRLRVFKQRGEPTRDLTT